MLTKRIWQMYILSPDQNTALSSNKFCEWAYQCHFVNGLTNVILWMDLPMSSCEWTYQCHFVNGLTNVILWMDLPMSSCEWTYQCHFGSELWPMEYFLQLQNSRWCFTKFRNSKNTLFWNGNFMYSYEGLTGKTYMKRISNVYTSFLWTICSKR